MKLSDYCFARYSINNLSNVIVLLKTMENQEGLTSLLRENVAYKLKRGKTKEAVSVLEHLHE